ncbi:MAG: LysM peptidoglycan-binding domain-containing protein [Candidatus Latescibacteria bacterium]|nr:LysM peptidoglycan-binding domain-containing protein [Candidatus Latescibacterota bacterium]
MTHLRRFGFLLVCTALLVPQVALAQTRGMTYDEYKIKLAQYEGRTADANAALAECKKAGEELSKQIADLDAQIATVQGEIYDLVDGDEASVNDYLSNADQIEARLMGLLSLSEADLFDKRGEVDQLKALLEALKGKKMALLPDAQQKLRNIDQLLNRIDARMPAKRIEQYTVLRGDSLWKIAKKPDIYADPYMWPRIYVENRMKIKDPDLIYPNWILNVPFGVDLNQHLVVSGQHLSSIAAKVYNDVTKWHKLYEANKAQILTPNLIFPAQVLDVPVN